jgi:predicted RNase H-like HicB family nuclease
MMKITIEKDGKGYLAQVEGAPELYAFGYTEQECLRELSNVVEMVADTYLPESSPSSLATA